MKCPNPRIFRITGPDGTDTLQFFPCGEPTCYACGCTSRAEVALRMRYEMQDSYNVKKYFITLTYDDKHLPCCIPDEYRQNVLNYISLLPIGERRYDFCVLVRSHLSNFMEKLLDEFRLQYCNGRYNEHKKVVTDEQNTLLRFYATGEYGDISHRPHYHAVICFPRVVNLFDVINLLQDCWDFGNFDVEPVDTLGAVNYVAKHEVKECFGSDFQQLVAPIFSSRSNYHGGIGRIMLKDEVMKNRYLDSIVTRDKDNLYYSAYGKGVEYKVNVPRYCKKIWHPNRFTDSELVLAQKDSIENLIKFCFDTLEKNFYISGETLEKVRKVKFEFMNIKSEYDLYHTLDVQNYNNLRAIADMLMKLNQPLIIKDMQRREVYLNKHISKKLKKIASNSSNYKDT